MKLVHHHLIYQARAANNQLGTNSEKVLKQFLYDLVRKIGMQCLIPVQLKLSYQKAWTGLVGIVTSHIAFHYWVRQKHVQLDIYSCKKFDPHQAVEFINQFWQAKEEKVLFIDRKVDEEFEIINF